MQQMHQNQPSTKTTQLLHQEQQKPLFTRTRLKFRFPDGFSLVATFGAKESLSDIYTVVREHLACPSQPFVLFDTPPKRVLEDTADTLLYRDPKLVPSATLFCQFAD